MKYKSSLTGKWMDSLPSTQIFPIKLNRSHSSMAYECCLRERQLALFLLLHSNIKFYLFIYLCLVPYRWLLLFFFSILFICSYLQLPLPVVLLQFYLCMPRKRSNCWLSKNIKRMYFMRSACYYYICIGWKKRERERGHCERQSCLITSLNDLYRN